MPWLHGTPSSFYFPLPPKYAAVDANHGQSSGNKLRSYYLVSAAWLAWLAWPALVPSVGISAPCR